MHSYYALTYVCVGSYMCRARSYARVQATVGIGTVLIWDFGVAYTRGGVLTTNLPLWHWHIHIGPFDKKKWHFDSPTTVIS